MRKFNILLAAIIFASAPLLAHATACSSVWGWAVGSCPDYTGAGASVLSIQPQTANDGSNTYVRISPETLTAAGLTECVVGGDVDTSCVQAVAIQKLKALQTQVSAISSGKAYEGTTLRSGAFPVAKTATVASGIAVFYLTADNTAGGTALCTNGVIKDSVNAAVSDATASYQMSWAFTNTDKTLTVTANKLTTSNILTGILGQAQANGTAIKLTVWCY